ncbi:MAG: hypothetical protein OXH70_00840 [Acidobacteria bacterium]|nr:hypothetical protein [Acidobacteriota bacterium]
MLQILHQFNTPFLRVLERDLYADLESAVALPRPVPLAELLVLHRHPAFSAAHSAKAGVDCCVPRGLAGLVPAEDHIQPWGQLQHLPD